MPAGFGEAGDQVRTFTERPSAITKEQEQIICRFVFGVLELQMHAKEIQMEHHSLAASLLLNAIFDLNQGRNESTRMSVHFDLEMDK